MIRYFDVAQSLAQEPAPATLYPTDPAKGASSVSTTIEPAPPFTWVTLEAVCFQVSTLATPTKKNTIAGTRKFEITITPASGTPVTVKFTGSLPAGMKTQEFCAAPGCTGTVEATSGYFNAPLPPGPYQLPVTVTAGFATGTGKSTDQLSALHVTSRGVKAMTLSLTESVGTTPLKPQWMLPASAQLLGLSFTVKAAPKATSNTKLTRQLSVIVLSGHPTSKGRPQADVFTVTFPPQNYTASHATWKYVLKPLAARSSSNYTNTAPLWGTFGSPLSIRIRERVVRPHDVISNVVVLYRPV